MRSDGLAALTRATAPHSQSVRLWHTIWAAAFLAGGVVDIWRMTKHDGTTLSASIRYAFGTDTNIGKARFLTALAILAWHILN